MLPDFSGSIFFFGYLCFCRAKAFQGFAKQRHFKKHVSVSFQAQHEHFKRSYASQIFITISANFISKSRYFVFITRLIIKSTSSQLLRTFSFTFGLLRCHTIKSSCTKACPTSSTLIKSKSTSLNLAISSPSLLASERDTGPAPEKICAIGI